MQKDSNESKPAKAGPRRFNRSAKISLRGATAPSETPYVRVSACGRHAWVPFGSFRSSAGEDALARRNIILIGDDRKTLRAKLDALDDFPHKPLIEEPGWSAQHFALPDGTVLGPVADGAKKPVVLFEPARGKCRAAGTLEDWLKHVAVPLIGQHLACFALMFMFAAPLLRIIGRNGNFGFELAGPKGVGKTTLQYLASSVAGPAMDAGGRNYWVSANATVAGLEGVMAEHADLPLIIEETNLFAAGSADRQRAAQFNELVFRLADGSVKARYQDHAQKRFRFLYLTSTNEPLNQVLAGHRIAVSDAAADRLLTLPLGFDRPFGSFDSVPAEYEDARAFAAALTSAVRRYHGTPLRWFLDRLVRAKNKDPARLRGRIERSMTRFREKVDGDRNSGSEARVADAFGLVFAAGKLAQEYGTLPRDFKCLKAARVAHELNRSAMERLTPKDRLLRLAARKDLIKLVRGKLPDLTDDQLTSVPGFISSGRGGRRELLLHPSAFHRAFADTGGVLRDPDVRKMLVCDTDRRQTVKRRLRANRPPERAYCFVLPRDED